MSENNFSETWKRYIKGRLKEGKPCVYFVKDNKDDSSAIYVFPPVEGLLKNEKKIDKIKTPAFFKEDITFDDLQKLLEKDQDLLEKVKARYKGETIYLIRKIEDAESFLEDITPRRADRGERLNFREHDMPYHG